VPCSFRGDELIAEGCESYHASGMIPLHMRKFESTPREVQVHRTLSPHRYGTSCALGGRALHCVPSHSCTLVSGVSCSCVGIHGGGGGKHVDVVLWPGLKNHRVECSVACSLTESHARLKQVFAERRGAGQRGLAPRTYVPGQAL